RLIARDRPRRCYWPFLLFLRQAALSACSVCDRASSHQRALIPTFATPSYYDGLLMGASLYDPINVYKPVAPDIGIVDGPFEHLTVGGVRLPLPFTTRMTVVRLSNGDLFLHSPIRFEGGVANELLGLGVVRYLVSPNQFHYAHIGEWAK